MRLKADRIRSKPIDLSRNLYRIEQKNLIRYDAKPTGSDSNLSVSYLKPISFMLVKSDRIRSKPIDLSRNLYLIDLSRNLYLIDLS